MTPVEEAKAHVHEIFFALTRRRDLCWKERMQGGWSADTSLPSSNLHGSVEPSGEYCVSVMRFNGEDEVETRIVLASGSYGYAEERKRTDTLESFA